MTNTMQAFEVLQRRCSVSASQYHLLIFFAILLLHLSSTQASSVASDDVSKYGQVPLIPSASNKGSHSSLNQHEFSLRQVFYHKEDDGETTLRKFTVDPDRPLWVMSDDNGKPAKETISLVAAKSAPMKIERLKDRRIEIIESYLDSRQSAASISSKAPWVIDEVAGPDVTDKETILTLVKMTANDYIEEPETGDWIDAGGPFNHSMGFGWKGDGLRGHIYADSNNSTIIMSLKGTSVSLFDGAATSANDKLNDNLHFSCCCGQGGPPLWRKVCDCYTSPFKGNLTCITEALLSEDHYYRQILHLYKNVTAMYPNSQLWLTGHSLGGAMVTLLGLTFGLPTVAFEAIPAALPAARLGLPVPPGYDANLPQTRRNTGVYQFGHTADPIYIGACNGVNSFCTWAGYSLQTLCHAGKVCTYDTVKDKGWRVSINTHRTVFMIPEVYEAYDNVAACVDPPDCYDCSLWEFFRSNSSESTTTSNIISSTTSSTTSRTATCKTPGWWGCLDKTTTTTTTIGSHESSTTAVTTPV